MHADTAGAAKDVSRSNDPKVGAIASRLAAEIYDLDILFESAEDDIHNTTRFFADGLTTINSEARKPDDHNAGISTAERACCTI